MNVELNVDCDLGCCPFLGGGSVVVYLLFDVLEFCVYLCFVMHYLVSILVCDHLAEDERKRKLIALLLLSYRCIATINVLWFFLAVPWVGLQYVVVVFPGHTHLRFPITMYHQGGTI